MPLYSGPGHDGDHARPEQNAVNQGKNSLVHVRTQPAAHEKCTQHHQKAIEC